MELLFGLLIGLVVLSIPFVLPIVSWVYARGTRARVERLEAAVESQAAAIERLTARLAELRRDRPGASPAEEGTRAAAPVSRPQPTPPVSPVTPTPPPAATPVEPRPRPPAPPPLVEPKPAALTTPPEPRVAAPGAGAAAPPPPPPPETPRVPFDWEGLVGVKLFSAIAGVALVLATVFFLKYSIDHGWLQPPVRVLIGVLVGAGLLVVCEMKAARRYPVTANALDAAAIAILFSTFFAAHALWDLIPAAATFALLAVVTAVAVLLSIRRESLFIALLGLVGGFATPVLLSTGENRPIPLFAYLLLLNIGLAWVAQRQTWPLLSVLTLVLTTIYQWGWVLKFLAASDLSLAMGIFLVFPVVTFAGSVLARRGDAARHGAAAEPTFERTALAAAVLPLFFAMYLAAVPAYGARAPLLFGFLLIIDAGLLAIAIGRQQPVLHAGGALATLLVMATWLSLSYAAGARHTAIAFTVVFVLLYLAAPALARRLGRPLADPGEHTEYAAPALLFVFPVLAAIDQAFAAPLLIFTVLGLLVAACAARAIATRRGFVYYVAAFFAVATQAVWSARFLTPDRLGAAVTIYAVFGVMVLAVPVLARRLDRPLEPAGAAGVLQLATLGLLLYLAQAPVAPEALWALALLLAIVNAGVFIESASAALPLLSHAGSIFSWIVLATWWWRAAASVGLLPSLSVVAALTLVTLGGHAWAHRHASRAGEEAAVASFGDGLYLGLAGHLFLLMVALNREWSVPPWPLFGTLLVLTLATSTASLVTGASRLHAAGAIFAGVVVAWWTSVGAVPPWPLVGLIASGLVAAYALGWQHLTGQRSGAPGAVAPVVALFVVEIAAVIAAAAPGAPSFWTLLAAHVVTLSVLLAVVSVHHWPRVTYGAVAIAWYAVVSWKTRHDAVADWPHLLVFTGVIYALFTAYPMVLGKRAAGVRPPWIAALIAAGVAFLLAYDAFEAARLDWMAGVIPVVQGLVTAVLLRTLLRLEPPGQRDLGRLALVGGVALAFVTVAIPLQLEEQWITIGWALEGAALAWLYTRVPHRGLLYTSVVLLAAVFVRLVLNPEVFRYEPRGELRILNWYLYTYVLAAGAFLLAGWWLSRTDEEIGEALPRPSRALAAGAVILLFLLLNIEIADYYAAGPEIVFRFGAGVSQDLTYTIGWLAFGMLLLAAGIYAHARAARVTAVALIAVTTFKCFLYDLGSLQGLYRVASFVGLAASLALVSVVLQKFVLARPKEQS